MKYVNDDYCDCVASGDDEPGTAACNGGRFWCENLGYKGRYIYSSLVDDGLCDCCDGSDERNNPRVECRNSCAEKAQQELSRFVAEKQKLSEGLKMKHSLMQVASTKLSEKQHRRQQIQRELTEKREALRIAEEEKQMVEEKERAYKQEKETRAQQERERVRAQAIAQCKANGGGEDCEQAIDKDSEADGAADGADGDGGEDTGESERARRRRERREQRFADRTERNEERRRQEQEMEREMEQGMERAAEEAARTERNEERRRQEMEMEREMEQGMERAAEEAAPHHHEHTPDEEFPYPEQYRPHSEEGEEQQATESESESETVQHHEHTPDEEFPYPEQYRPHDDDADVDDVDEDTEAAFDWSEFDEDVDEMDDDNVDMAAPIADVEQQEQEDDPVMDELSNAVRTARDAYNSVDREIRNLENDLKEIDKVLRGNDFGDQDVFASLLGECYAAKIGKYEYEFCPFNKATQKEGHSSTNLGTFKSFKYDDASDDGELIMVFDDGQKCWNGPKRSMHVAFKCNVENEVLSVTEPSTCKYHMTFNSPLACSQRKLETVTQILNHYKTEL
eukprot:CAMPEP_0202728470 /NCGR_PEP_ID=MMETSP1385-20130828/185640_1 /ASSEMBLY_ACC=CAM_ASM_000861 /TAXON_ID=933848 /ORGANISM="Elphidium margaritaceum" /LENGTH=566 /DNA_ID=CAMNT_0049394719 /DNA_START=246 /DNA_END=1946 /DNA_ORIENTATION=-